MKQNYLSYAKKMLVKGDYTCVLHDGKTTFTSVKRGVAPLLAWVEEDRTFEGFVAADKVVGRAAAFLYVLLNVDAVYCGVISKSAAEVFEKYEISYTYDVMADEIINRKKTGCCPMETATKNIESPEEALIAIKKKVLELNQ